jgi:hypothetical protein
MGGWKRICMQLSGCQVRRGLRGGRGRRRMRNGGDRRGSIVGVVGGVAPGGGMLVGRMRGCLGMLIIFSKLEGCIW